jgi:hypothetical protein
MQTKMPCAIHAAEGLSAPSPGCTPCELRNRTAAERAETPGNSLSPGWRPTAADRAVPLISGRHR